MSTCQVSGCQRLGTVRCDNGFAYCDEHKKHGHVRGDRIIVASLRKIKPDGDFYRRHSAEGVKDADKDRGNRQAP